MGLRIEIFIIRSNSYVSHPTHSQSKLDNSELTVPEVTTRHTSARSWIDTCHDLGGSESDHYRCPFCSLLLERGRELFLGGFQVPGVSDV